MKIGIVTNFVDGNLGGIGTYTNSLIKSLTKIDTKNTYYLIHYSPVDIDIYRDNNEILIKRYSHLKGSGFIWRYISTPLKLKRMKNLDVVHDPYEIGPLSFKMPFKKVITLHDLTPILFPHTFDSATILLHRLLFSKSIRMADKIITVSNSTKQDLISYFNIPLKKICVIYEAADEKFKPLDADKVNLIKKKYSLNFPFILYVGTLEPRKNIPTLLRAYSELKKKSINHKLVIAGKKGWKYNEIFELIHSLDLQNDVIFTGFILDEDLPGLYNAADLFVYPSIYEGFGLPPLEAMACGCPVITSNTSSLPEVVGDAGIMIDPYNTKQLSESIYKVLNNTELKQDMRVAGLKRASLFSWEKAAVETLEVYRSLYH